MTWENFYLGCFLVGFALAASSFAAGFLHLPFHGVHLPHGPGHAHGAGHGPGDAGVAAHPNRPSGSPLNFSTAMAFLAWFGGTGYLLTGHSSLATLVVLAVATAAGTLGAGVVFGFLTRVLLRREAALDPADFVMVGVLGRITVPIRNGGTGEITFSQGRTRRCSGARLEGAADAAKGAEVVVTRYEKGIAYVRPFEEL
ncbi:MAG: hypothetical protein ABI682_16295 [Acidobacteriota bacterium]